MLPSPSTFKLSADAGGVATLTLDRPGRKNALTIATYEELRDVFRACAQQMDLAAVILTGANGDFCSGGDVHEIIGSLLTYSEPQLRAFNELTTACVVAMQAMPQILIAAIDGVAAGGGAALALGADLRLMTDRARMGFVFPHVGLCAGDMAVSWRLPRLIGAARAAELLLFGDFIGAQTAREMGLTSRVVTPEDLVPTAEAWARRFATGPRHAQARTKALLSQAFDLDLDAGVKAEVQAQTACMLEPDFREGHAAFVNKRPAKWGAT